MTRFSRFARLAAAALLASPLVAAADSARPIDTPQVIARVRESLGLSRLTPGKALRLTGSARYLGSDTVFEAVFDTAGRSIVSYSGEVSQVTGFDGTNAWTTDLGGETRLEHHGDRATTIITAAVLSGLWFAEKDAGRFTIDEPRTTDSAVTLAFSYDDGKSKGAVEIDRATWRPTRWTLDSGASNLSWTFAGSISADGLNVPARIVFTTEHGGDNPMTIVRAEIIDAPVGRLALPAAAVAPHAFDPHAPAALEIKKAPTGHLLVRASWDGGEPGWFIFDTGAGMNCIDTGVIAERGYAKVGEVPALGVGGAVTSPLVRAKSLRVGPLTLESPLCVGLDLRGLSVYMGEPIVGIVGYNAIACSIAEIDTLTPAVSLHEPRAYRLERGEWTEMTLYGRHPCFAGSIEGKPAMFKIDTGANRTTVCADAVKRMRMLVGRETTPSKMGGVGGFVESAQGKVALLEFAGTRHEDVLVDFAKEHRGALADPYVDVNVGGKLIADYTLILDYQNRRGALVKR